MTAAPSASASTPWLRLASQIQTLSELTESLAFRLLELEERLVAQELSLQPLLEAEVAVPGEAASDTELRLEETEERLARLETLLRGLEGPAASAQGLHLVALPEAEESQEIFYEDEEQAFSDDAGDEADCLSA